MALKLRPRATGLHSGRGDPAQRRPPGSRVGNVASRRPALGQSELFQRDPNWRDLIPFHEYFHGDNGAGIGASHQTGWTGLIAVFLDLFGRLDAKTVLETERDLVQARIMTEQVAGVTVKN